MDVARPRWHWTDFDDLKEPPDAGRRLDAGGFILADPFDTLLHELSETYAHKAWQRVATILERYRLAPDDLSWGELHCGETYAPGFPPQAPSSYIGWTSRQLARFDQDERYADVDAALRAGHPALGCAFSWRSHKWHIAPEDADLGVQLIEALCICEPTDWAPAWILRQPPYAASTELHPDGPWIHVAEAIDQCDQQLLDSALAEAQAHYSPIGYRMMVRGYAAYLQVAGLTGCVQLPDVSMGP